ncbi:MAG: pyruvate formate lyase family protein, partial [Candidatus Hermodarchaeota archaeon]
MTETEVLELVDNASSRIRRFRSRFLDDIPFISIERAKYYTEKWQETENSNLPNNIRVALSMKNVFENMGVNIDPDDRIAGTWTENFLGIPIDIERGLFNRVFEVELDKKSMKAFAKEGNKGFMSYMIGKYGSEGFLKTLEHSKRIGVTIPELGTDTLDIRKINPYQIKEKDKEILLKDLLPYWKEITIADRLGKAYDDHKIYPGEFGDFIKNLPRSTGQSDM